MKLRKEQRDLHMGDLPNEKKVFGIKQNAKMFSILSDKLYSNKPAAIVRELGCNALDAHVAAGNTDAFTVHVPNTLEPWYSIRDYGIGLSHDDVMVLFSTYGVSTKDNSDLFIGALGLGTKSPFAYTDSYTVVSYFQGMLRTYNAYINEDGEPTITLVSAVPTQEPNGLEITVPIVANDYSQFCDEVQKYYSHYPVWPTIRGNNQIKPVVFKYTVSGKGWAFLADTSGRSAVHYQSYRNRSGSCVALMGNVPYPVDISQLEAETDSQDYQSFVLPFFQRKSHLFFELGDLDMAASREALSYDKVTVANIVNRIKSVQVHLLKELTKEIAACPTEWSARIKLWDRKALSSKLGKGTKIEWRGIELNIDDHFMEKTYTTEHRAGELNFYDFSAHDFCNKNLNFLGGKLKERYNGGFKLRVHPDNNYLFMTMDCHLDHKRIPSRLHKYFHNLTKAKEWNDNLFAPPHITIIEGDRATCKKVLSDYGNPPHVIEFNEANVPDVPRIKPTSGVNGYTVVKLKQFDYKGRHPGWGRNQDSADWKAAPPLALDQASGYYVDIRNNNPVYLRSDNKTVEQESSNRCLNDSIVIAVRLGLLTSNTIVYGCPGAVKNHMRDHKNWTNLYDAIHMLLFRRVGSSTFKSNVMRHRRWEGMKAYGTLWSCLKKDKGKLPQDLASYSNMVSSCKQAHLDLQLRWLIDLDIKLCQLSLPRLLEALDTDELSVYSDKTAEKYKLLFALNRDEDSLDDFRSNIIDYANLLN